MTSFEDVVGRNTTTQVEWGVVINGTDFSRQLELLEFEHQLNNPFQFTVRLSGVDGSVKISENAEVALKRRGTVFFRGVARQVEPKTENVLQLQAAGYPAALEGDVSNKFKDSTVKNVTNSIVDNTTIESANPSGTGRTFQTSFNLSTTFNVSDFRANEKQLGEVNRLLGEYDLEWYSTFDSNNNPVFNVTEELINTASDGSSLDTLTTYGSEQTAEKVRHNVNSEKGSFDGVLVRGYGDGDDQVTATAGNTGKDNRVLIYTDKTILSDSQAQQRADKLQELKTVKWQEIEVDLTNPNRVFGIGDKLTVDAKDAKLNDDYRVVKTSYKIRPSRSEFEATLTLSNKPATFVDEFNREKNKNKSQTDYGQGSTVNWGDKEASNATSAEPLEIDFEVPKDVVGLAGQSRLNRIELNYACKPYKQTGTPQSVEATNFDPGIKQVDTSITPGGIGIEKDDLTAHNHPVGSSTSFGATDRISFQNGFSFVNDVPADRWVSLTQLSPVAPENDLKHRIKIDVKAIDSTADLHYAVLSNNPVANFTTNPLSPEPGETVQFEDTSSEPEFGNTVQRWDWDFGDGTTETVTTSPGDTFHTYSSSGTFTATLEIYDGNDNLLDDVSKDVRVLNTTTTTTAENEDNLESQDISAQSASIATGSPDPGDEVYLDDGVEITYDGSVDADSSGELTLTVVENTVGKGLVDKKTFSSAPNFEPYDLKYSFGTALNTFNGPGNYSYTLTYDDGSNITKTTEDGPTLGLCDPEIKSPNNNAVIQQSDVTFNIEGAYGLSSSPRQELFIEGPDFNGKTSVQDLDIQGGTAPNISEGQQITITLDGEENVIELVDVDNDTGAFIRINGQLELLSEGEILPNTTVKDRVVLSKVSNNLKKDVVLSLYNKYSHTETGLSDGQYTATVEWDAPSDDPNIPDKVVTDSVDFEIQTNNPPTADFSFSPSNPEAFQTVTFNDQSTDPDGDNTIQKWEWDFGDGTTRTLDGTSGDTSHAYGSSGDFTVSLKVTDDSGVSNTTSQTITVTGGETLQNTVEYSGVKNVGASTASAQTLTNANTVDFSGVSNVGTQKTPAEDSFMLESIDIPYRDMSSTYEVYLATQGDQGVTGVSGQITLQEINHAHDVPRQDDFAEQDPDIGSGAENKEISLAKSSDNRGEVFLDFSSNNEPITLDTTINSNDVTITVAVEDASGNITNSETITANNGTASTSNSYAEDDDPDTGAGAVRITVESASNNEKFEVRDSSGQDSFELAAITKNSFQSDTTSQDREIVSDDSGKEQTVIQDVDTDLLAGTTADNVKLFIDDEPDQNTSSEREITGAVYGANDSGTPKDREVQINRDFDIQAVDASSNTVKISGDQSSYIRADDPLKIFGTENNDGRFTVSSVSYDSGSDQTLLTVNEAVTNESAKGSVEWRIVNDPGWYSLKIVPNEPTFIKSRVYFDHHKESE